MKRFFIILLAVSAFFASCTDKELTERVSVLEEKVSSLEAFCEDLNTNVIALQAFVENIKNNLYVASVAPVTDGFVITFTDGTTYTIKNGDKGSKGDKGDKGDQGDIGPTPIVGLKLHTDGVYYWTVNGEWLMADDKMVSAVGATPVLKVENGKWMVSYNSTTWEEVAPAYDYSTVLTVTEDTDAVYIKQHDGTTFTLPKVPGFGFKVAQVKDIAVVGGATVSVPYTVTAGDETVEFDVRGAAGFTAVVEAEDLTKGVVKITAPDPFVSGYVVVTAIQNSTGISKSQYLSFEEGKMMLVTDAGTIDGFGGNLTISVNTNVGVKIEIPEDVDWITPVEEVKSMAIMSKQVFVKENPSTEERRAILKIVSEGLEPLNFTVVQSGSSTEAAIFSISKDSAKVPAKGKNVTIDVIGNVPWTVTCPQGVTAEPMSGSGNGSVVFTVAANTGSELILTPTIQTTVANANPSSYTITITQEKYSQYDFSYVLWGVDENNIGNNLGLTPIMDYPNQFRVNTGEKVELSIMESDIPEGAPVSYKWVDKKGGLSQSISVNSNNGKITIYSGNYVSCNVGLVEVTVGGDDESAVTRSIPVFVHRTGFPSSNLKVEYTPFVVRVNPFKGGEGVAPKVYKKDGTELSIFTLELRKNFYYHNFYGNTEGRTEGKQNAAGMYLDYVWNRYYEAIGNDVNYAAANPFIVSSNSTDAAKAAMPLYIDPTDQHVVVRAGKFVTTSGIPADGVLFGTCSGGEVDNPIGSSAKEFFQPFVIWFDPEFEN